MPRASSKMRLSNGGFFDYKNPSGKYLNIEVVAHSLAILNRFTGQSAWPYSDAQHSILVSYLIEDLGGDPREGFTHDFPECVMADLNSPLKANCQDYKRIEQLVTEAAFVPTFEGALAHKSEACRLADAQAYLVERDTLMLPSVFDDDGDAPDAHLDILPRGRAVRVKCMPWNHAKWLFMLRASELGLKEPNPLDPPVGSYSIKNAVAEWRY